MLYALHDSNPTLKRKGAFPIRFELAKEYNKMGYGIFFTPNKFKGDRKAENLQELRFYVADLDEGTKEEQMARIRQLTIQPSKIVESNKGFHCYWRIREYDKTKPIEFILDDYKKVERGLVAKLNADPHATDVSRLLRYPNFYHLKNPNNPFLVHVIEENSRQVTDKQMLFAFKLPEKKQKVIQYEGSNQDMILEENWNKYFGFNQAMTEGRNNYFTRVTFWLRDEGFPKDVIESVCENMNNKLSKPLDKWELNTILKTKL